MRADDGVVLKMLVTLLGSVLCSGLAACRSPLGILFVNERNWTCAPREYYRKGVSRFYGDKGGNGDRERR